MINVPAVYRHPYQFLNRMERFVRREESNLNWREREIGEEGESNLNCEDKGKCGLRVVYIGN